MKSAGLKEVRSQSASASKESGCWNLGVKKGTWEHWVGCNYGGDEGASEGSLFGYCFFVFDILTAVIIRMHLN